MSGRWRKIMKPIKLAMCLIAFGAISSASAISPVTAQVQQPSQPGMGGSQQRASPNGVRYPSATQPNNNNPFQNPIGQGVAPATNVNPGRNNQVIAPNR
jgi:hypothetical protein